MASHDLVDSGKEDFDTKRRNALAEIDNAKFGWFHVRTIVVTGVGFFTDAYDLFAVNFVTVMLGYVYYSSSKNALPTNLELGIKISAQCGTFIGQLLFVISSEFANKKRRGAMIGSVFAMQGFGILAAAIMSTILLAAYKPNIKDDRNVNQATEDIAVVLGRKERATTIEEEDVVRVEAPTQSWQDFKAYFGKWENGKILLGTSLSWFLLDIAFYGIGLNNSVILSNIGYAKDPDPFKTLWNLSIGNILIAVLGTVPGYWFTVALVDVWGRKPIQLMGFGVLTVLFLVLGVAYKQILKTSTALFIVIFTLCQFFQNFGPNTTTFIIPGEVFPTRYRSTGHGISAASGKLGAIISQVGFLRLKDIGGKDAYVDKVIIIFAPIMFLGVLATLLIPETKNRSLEDLSNEKQVGFISGVHHKPTGNTTKEIEAKS
ncbi:962_t:CDS:2 [Paraglomus brasilianum]|uniref:962_t:CDS:1 n=1 Tax=Paraglomus brasilianum TaxID=144538 RepID=A0A9N9FQW6_9GLOM|nr:962_t:CDS:2 [Paraglomus brasilianum]